MTVRPSCSGRGSPQRRSRQRLIVGERSRRARRGRRASRRRPARGSSAPSRADDHGRARARAGRPASAAPSASGRRSRCRHARPARAQLGHAARAACSRGALVDDEEDVDRRRPRRIAPRARARAAAARCRRRSRCRASAARRSPRRARRSGRRRRSCDCAPSSASYELERRARVVVEAAHERRLERVGDAVRVEVARARRRMLAAGVAERLADLRRAAQRLPHALGFFTSKTRSGVVARLARASSSSSAVVLVEPGGRALDVRRPAVRVADRVQLQLLLRDAEPRRELVVQLDHLGVDGGIGGADRLDRAAASARGSGPSGARRSGTSGPIV